jgi:hypothetical protein
MRVLKPDGKNESLFMRFAYFLSGKMGLDCWERNFTSNFAVGSGIYFMFIPNRLLPN